MVSGSLQIDLCLPGIDSVPLEPVAGHSGAGTSSAPLGTPLAIGMDGFREIWSLPGILQDAAAFINLSVASLEKIAV